MLAGGEKERVGGRNNTLPTAGGVLLGNKCQKDIRPELRFGNWMSQPGR